jgi:iron complex outermembrane receptor protein
VAVCAACTVTDPKTSGGLALIDGNPLPQAPRTTANVTLKYTAPGRRRLLRLHRLGLPRQGQLLPLREQGVHRQGAARGRPAPGLQPGATASTTPAVFVRNVTNQIRIVGGIDFNNLTGFINEPRTYGVTLRASF